MGMGKFLGNKVGLFPFLRGPHLLCSTHKAEVIRGRGGRGGGGGGGGGGKEGILGHPFQNYTH